ncbi:MAG TPA: hypothetical protein HA366_03155 [Candidatus Methanomethylophilaceae archaeon]|nr:hypothetical protein [Candidatus Methanomethylophilaceae archaeon]
MYCSRCNRSISSKDIEHKNQELKYRFGVDSLERGICPVCGTKLIKRGGKDED